MPLLKDVLSPINGLFANMPQDIWGPELDPTFMDIELFTRLGGLEISPTAEYFVTDGDLNPEQLALLLYQRYKDNWQRMWNAVTIEYDMLITSSVKEDRTVNRDNTNTETRDLHGTEGGTVDDTATISGSNVRSGSVTTAGSSDLVRDLTDLETRELKNTTTDVGTSTTDGTATENNTVNDTLTKTGSESTSGSNSNLRTGSHDTEYVGSETNQRGGSVNTTESKTGTESQKRTVAMNHIDTTTTTENGSEVKEINFDETKVINGSWADHTATNGEGNVTNSFDYSFGIGGGGGALGTPSGRNTTDQKMDQTSTRDYDAYEERITRGNTPNLNENREKTTFEGRVSAKSGGINDTGTDNTDITYTGRTDTTNVEDTTSDTKSFTGRSDNVSERVSDDGSSNTELSFLDRKDTTVVSEDKSATTGSEESHNNTVTADDTGTRSNKQTGTEGTTDNSTQTFDDLTDTNTGATTNKTTKALTNTDEGTVANVGNEMVTETFTSEGSSPLRTYQALIQEEIEGRSGQVWNFTDLVIRDVQEIIVSKIWKRKFLV